MLKFLLFISCLLAIVFGAGTISETSSESTKSESTSSESTSESTSGETATTTKSAIVKSNFFQTSFLGLLYIPYAMNKCSATSPSTSIMPTCTDTTHVSLKSYSSADCSGTALVSQFNTSSPGTIFKCDGANTFAQIVLGASGSCFATVYAALDACTQYSTSSTVYYSAYTCSSASKGYLSLYTTSSCSTPITAYTLNSTCNYEFTSGAYQVYGQILNCSAIATTTTTSSGSTTSASTTTGTTSDANMVGLKNIFAIVMIAICIIAKL